MRITLGQLRRIIREEVSIASKRRRVNEGPALPPPPPVDHVGQYAEADRPILAEDWVDLLGGMKTVEKEAASVKLSQNTVEVLASLGVKSPSPQFLKALVRAAKGGMLTKGEMAMLKNADIEIPSSGFGLKIGGGYDPSDAPVAPGAKMKSSQQRWDPSDRPVR